MKIFSITMVKNEIDIIETFIRYHVQLFDGMVILDNGSTDGTEEIVNKLMAEGLPIYLLFDDNPSYDQSAITTNMLYKTIEQFSPDFVLPLDVDEFLVSNINRPIRKTLESQLHSDKLHFLSWTTYIPTKDDDSSELNPLKRIQHRRKEQHNYDKKVFIPTEIVRKHHITIRQGNHDVDGVEADMSRVNLDGLDLAHIPIRSGAQLRSKYLVGWLTNLARDRQVLFDWYYYYNVLKQGEPLAWSQITELALRYDVPDKRVSMELVKDPIRLDHVNDIRLTYTPRHDVPYFQNVLSYTENLARKYSKLKKRVDNDSSDVSEYSDQLILQNIRTYQLIEGWLSPREAITLFRLVQSVDGDNVTVCEIGSWLGKSSYILARALETHHDGRLFCVDPFDASGDSRSEGIYKDMEDKLDSSLLERFKDNMEKHGVLDRITIMKGLSHEIVKNFKNSIDVSFIDGNHDYESVLRDFKDWSRLIRKGGFIAFHDVGAAHTTGPKQVVELEIVRDPMWGEQQLVDEIYIAKKMK